MIVIGANEVAPTVAPPRRSTFETPDERGFMVSACRVLLKRTGASPPRLVPSRADQSSSTTLHKLHVRLTKVSALPILKSTHRKDEMSAGGTFRQTWDIPDVGCFALDFDFRSRLWLRLWCKGVALVEAIGTISSLRALYSGLDGGRSNPGAGIIVDYAHAPTRQSGRSRNNHVRLG
jgi:hypothetical protein